MRKEKHEATSNKEQMHKMQLKTNAFVEKLSFSLM